MHFVDNRAQEFRIDFFIDFFPSHGYTHVTQEFRIDFFIDFYPSHLVRGIGGELQQHSTASSLSS
jgi:hypothetical protein